MLNEQQDKLVFQEKMKKKKKHTCKLVLAILEYAREDSRNGERRHDENFI